MRLKKKKVYKKIQRKSPYDARFKAKVVLSLLCVFLYFLCVYAALSGEIPYLQIYTEKTRGGEINGYNWMLLAILVSGIFTISNDSIFKTMNKFEWREKHNVLTFIIECVIPSSILILLNVYKAHYGWIGVSVLVITIFIFYICAHFKTIVKKIKMKFNNKDNLR